MVIWILILLVDVPLIGLTLLYVHNEEQAFLLAFLCPVLMLTVVMLLIRWWQTRKEAEKGLTATLERGHAKFAKSGISEKETHYSSDH